MRELLSEKDSRKLDKVLKTLTTAEEEGEIWNVTYKETNDCINSLMSNLSSLGQKDLLNGKYREETRLYIEENGWEKYSRLLSSSTASVNKLIREESSKGNLPDWMDEFLKIYFHPINSLKERLVALKPYIKMGRKPQENTSKRYTPPMASKSALEIVRENYKEILKPWAQEFQKNTHLKILQEINTYIELEDKDSHIGRGIISRHHYCFNRSGSLNKRDSLKENYEEVIALKAKEFTNDILSQFINKNAQKIASIIDKKNNLHEITLLSEIRFGSRINCELKIKFKDGSCFTVRNKTTESYFHYKFFPVLRFPTTFHDIKLSSGTSYKSWSEEEMNNNFQ